MRKVIVTSQNKALMVDSKLLGTQDWGLPPEYQELQYVSVTSGYIDTGEKTTKASVVEGYVNAVYATSTYLWVSDTSSSGSSNTTAYFSTSGYWRFGSRYITIYNNNYYGSFHTYKQSSSGVWVDGSSSGSYSTMSAFTSTANLRFGASTASNIENRWKWFKHTKGDDLVSYYKACKRVSDNAAGFYDLITETFTEAGTAGPAIE